MKVKSFILLCLITMLSACYARNTIELTVYDEVINPSYIGNGIEWDPYDEAASWGNPLSDDDWEKLFARLDYMRPAYVRCMFNSPYRYYDSASGEYNPERNLASMTRLLDYCRKNDIMVVFGEYNPPTWDMKEEQAWIDMSVDYLNTLVCRQGYDCIKHFVIFNEPDGDWAAPNGDFDMWLAMLGRFHQKMAGYPGLLEKVSLAGPDVVADYKNPNSRYDTGGWLEKTVANADTIIGLYDIHAYPGQAQVRNGSYRDILKGYKAIIPSDKQIILGEAGYKYWREPDSLLMAEYNRRVDGHPFTKGSDCNMLVYDNFYGLDMPLLISEVMNAGFSGVAAWMLDDAMHSNGDSGKPEDVKIWGMWNILGEEVFGDASQEDIRPWYYTWSLMCRYFPKGCNVIKTQFNSSDDGLFSVAAISEDGRMSVALINVSQEDHKVCVNTARALKNAKLYRFTEADGINLAENGNPLAEKEQIDTSRYALEMSAHSLVVLTEMD